MNNILLHTYDEGYRHKSLTFLRNRFKIHIRIPESKSMPQASTGLLKPRQAPHLPILKEIDPLVYQCIVQPPPLSPFLYLLFWFFVVFLHTTDIETLL